jgi:protein SCO1/2
VHDIDELTAGGAGGHVHEADTHGADAPRSTAPAGRGALWWVLFALAIAVAVAAGVLWRPAVELPVLGELPDFALTTEDGRLLGLADLRGKAWVAQFIFTRCRAACPGMSAQMARLQEAIRGDAALSGRVQLVSFTVDPDHDTPEKLREFGSRYGADPAVWRFASGRRQAVVDLCEGGFRLSAGGAVSPTGEVSGPTHSDRFALVDAEARVRGTYRPSAEAGDFERLLADLRALVAGR